MCCCCCWLLCSYVCLNAFILFLFVMYSSFLVRIFITYERLHAATSKHEQRTRMCKRIVRTRGRTRTKERRRTLKHWKIATYKAMLGASNLRIESVNRNILYGQSKCACTPLTKHIFTIYGSICCSYMPNGQTHIRHTLSYSKFGHDLVVFGICFCFRGMAYDICILIHGAVAQCIECLLWTRLIPSSSLHRVEKF